MYMYYGYIWYNETRTYRPKTIINETELHYLF